MTPQNGARRAQPRSQFGTENGSGQNRGMLPERLAARVVLLDPDHRVLLMRYDDGPPNGSHWTTPGGGLNEGEDFRAGALRELAEETGWADHPPLGEVLRQSLTMEYAGRLVRPRGRLYLARAEEPPG